MHDIEYIPPTARLLVRGMGCCKLQNNFIIRFEVQVYVLNIKKKKTEGKITLLNRKKERSEFFIVWKRLLSKFSSNIYSEKAYITK